MRCSTTYYEGVKINEEEKMRTRVDKKEIRRFVVASTHKFQIGKDEYIEMTNEADIEIT